jgi:hypothetical protein
LVGVEVTATLSLTLPVLLSFFLFLPVALTKSWAAPAGTDLLITARPPEDATYLVSDRLEEVADMRRAG